MRFLIDNQLPIALAMHLRERGHDCLHVLDLHLEEADDRFLWEYCIRENRILLSKDWDFIYLAIRPGDAGRLGWLRVGNCRNETLIRSMDEAHDRIVAAFESGRRVVEVRLK